MVAPTVLISLAFVLRGVLSAPVETQGISSDLYSSLTFYWKYATSAYATSCARPNGNTLVANFEDTTSILPTGTQGFIARDDTRKEIVVALRGTEPSRWEDVGTDANTPLVPYFTPTGGRAPFRTLVHAGFHRAYNSVDQTVTFIVRNELKNHPGYTLVTTGHSLGGALASLAAASLKHNFNTSVVRLYTYGQPRTGNSIYAQWINSMLGDRAFRSVHTNDLVPRVPPKGLINAPFGYQHHGVEYWLNPDPASARNTKKCAGNIEDPTCSLSIPFFNSTIKAHGVYYGISNNDTFCT